MRLTLPNAPVNSLAEKIAALQEDRSRHLKAIETIDRTLENVDRALGVLLGTGRNGDVTGRDAEVQPGTARRRGKFLQTGDASVLEFIRRKENPSTAEINAHWRSEGRKGAANVIILRLLRNKNIRRQEDPEVRGSRYLVV